MGSLYRLDQLSFKVLQLMNETGWSLQPAEDRSKHCMLIFIFAFKQSDLKLKQDTSERLRLRVLLKNPQWNL